MQNTIVALTILLLVTGCSSGLANLEMEVAQLKTRLDESVRGSSAMRARMDDLENRALLLQDELDTLRLVGMRDAARFNAPDALPVVKVSPTQAAAAPAVPYTVTIPTQPPTPPPAAPARAMVQHYSSEAITEDVYQSIDDQGRVVGPARKSERKKDLPVQRVMPTASKKLEDSDDESTILNKYRAAYDLYKQGSTYQAQAAFEAFVLAYPRHPYADNAQYWIGECFYDRREYERARVEFLRVINEHPNGNKVPDAMVKVGLCEQRLGRTAEAKRMYDATMLTYPETNAAAVAMKLLGEMP